MESTAAPDAAGSAHERDDGSRTGERTLDHIVELMLAGDRVHLQGELAAVFEEHGVAPLYEQVATPALSQVGERWAAGDLSIAEEHLATATMQTALAALYPRFPWPERGPRIVIACVGSEGHGLGARMVADLLGLDGWDDLYLGAGVPPAELVKLVNEREAVAVALSATVPSALKALGDAIDLLRSEAPEVRIIVGGRAVAAMPDGGASFGADAVAATASEAVEVCRAWK